MKCIKYINSLKLVLILLLCFGFYKFLYAQTNEEERILKDLNSAGYKVNELSKKTYPASDKTYYIVSATRNGLDLKIKVFDEKYFIAKELGKLEPLAIKNTAAKTAETKKPSLPALKTFNIKVPSESESDTGKTKPEVEQKEASKTYSFSTEKLNFLNSAEPSIRLASSSEVSKAAQSFNRGCYPSTFSRIADFGLGMEDTAKAINNAIARSKLSSQEFKNGEKVTDPSKDFKISKEGSAAAKIFKNVGKKNEKDPVSDYQKELEKSINSKEMYKYSLGRLWEILFSKKRSQNSTPDQMIATKNLENLVKNLIKQGKNKDEIYALLGKQLDQQFKGNVLLNGSNPENPWTLKTDGKISIYSLTNNRDQVLNFTAQALTLKNDPIYQSKRNEWLKTNQEYAKIKNSSFFEAEDEKTKTLVSKINKLSVDLSERQKEIFL